MRTELDTEMQRLLESRTREELIGAVVDGAGALVRADGVRAAQLTVEETVAYRLMAQRTAGTDTSAQVAAAPLAHPLIRHYFLTRTTDWVSIEDILPGRQWLEHPLYRDVYRPAGLRSQISCELVNSRGLITTLSLNRGGPDFGDAERELLVRYRRLLHAVWARVVELEETRSVLSAFDRISAKDGALLLVLDALHGEVLHVSDPFAAILSLRSDLVDEIRAVIAASPSESGAVFDLDDTRTLTLSWARASELIVVRGSLSDRLGLTAREAEVLQALSSGMTARAVAAELGVSVFTVNKHLEHAYAKLGAHDRVTAVAVGREHGIVR